MTVRASAVVLAVIGLLAVGPSVASAATLSVQGDTLVYQAAPGERNLLTAMYEQASPPLPPPEPVFSRQTLRLVTAAQSPGLFFYYFSQGGPGEGARAVLGAGCQDDPDSDDLVRCAAAGVTKLRFELGDGNDQLFWVGVESGLDVPASEMLVGGAGNDNLVGNYRSRRSVISAGSGKDVIGGATVARGGDGRDQLTGRLSSPSKLYGQGGADLVIPSTVRFGSGPTIFQGPVRAYGGTGNDELGGSRFADLLSGGPGDDRVIGYEGRDTLLGDSGNDDITSDERVPDRQMRRARDKVGCGAGRDRVTADRLDRFAGCEKVR